MKKKFPFHIIVFLFPACFIYSIFMIYPLLDTMRVSLYTQNLLGENMDDSSGVRAFIGLRNYYDLFFNDTWSWHFWNALKNNIYFFLLHISIQTPIGLLIAAFLSNRELKLKSAYRTLIFLPAMMSIVIVGYIFNLILLIKESLIIIVIFILLLFVDFKISFFTFSLLGSFSIIFYFASKKGAIKRGEIVQIFWGAILKAVNQGLGSVKETKILNKEDYISDVFDNNIKVVEKYNFYQSFIITLPKLFLEIIAILTIVVVSVLFFFLD